MHGTRPTMDDLRSDGEGLGGHAEQLELFALAVRYAADHIIITDSAGRILYANIAAERLTGYSFDEMRGATPALWGRQMGREFYGRLWQAIRDRKEQFIGELRNKRKDGVLYDAEIQVAPVLDRVTGEVRFYVGIERDITAQKNLERTKNEFLSLASHNLKTPLGTVAWYAEMLLDGTVGTLTHKQSAYVREVQTANARMLQLVRQLLSVSRIELAATASGGEAIDIGAIVVTIVHERAADLARRHLTLDTYYEHPLAPVRGEQVLLREAIENLIANAIAYTDPGGALTIRVFHKPANEEVYGRHFPEDRVVVMVGDTGCGIPRAEQGRMFEQFFRASTARERDANGIGIGLHLVHRVVQKLRGDIWFRSDPGVGTEFYVAFPHLSRAEA